MSDDRLSLDQDLREEAISIAKTIEQPTNLARALSSVIGSGIGQGVQRTTGIGAGTKAVIKKSESDKPKTKETQNIQ